MQISLDKDFLCVICVAAERREGEGGSAGEAAEHEDQSGATAQRSQRCKGLNNPEWHVRMEIISWTVELTQSATPTVFSKMMHQLNVTVGGL